MGTQEMGIIRSHVLSLQFVYVLCIFVMPDFSNRHFVACFVIRVVAGIQPDTFFFL